MRLVNQSQLLERLQMGLHRFFAETGEEPQAECAADHGGDLHRALDRLVELIDARPREVPNRLRKRYLGVAGPLPGLLPLF